MTLRFIISKHSSEYEVTICDNVLQINSVTSISRKPEFDHISPVLLEIMGKARMTHNDEENNLLELILFYNELGYLVKDGDRNRYQTKISR